MSTYLKYVPYKKKIFNVETGVLFYYVKQHLRQLLDEEADAGEDGWCGGCDCHC